jgi:hypothetical protein
VYLLYAVDVASVPPGEDLQVLGVSGQNWATHQLSKPLQAVQSGPLPIRSDFGRFFSLNTGFLLCRPTE